MTDCVGSTKGRYALTKGFVLFSRTGLVGVLAVSLMCVCLMHCGWLIDSIYFICLCMTYRVVCVLSLWRIYIFLVMHLSNYYLRTGKLLALVDFSRLQSCVINSVFDVIDYSLIL